MIRTRRLSLGLSQEELAHRVGMSRNYIGLLERGERKPTVETFMRIAEGLDVKGSQLLAEIEAALGEATAN